MNSIFIVFTLPVQEPAFCVFAQVFFSSLHITHLFLCLFMFRVCFISDFQITVLRFFKELLYMYKSSEEHGGKSLIKLRSFDLRSIGKIHQETSSLVH